jgi:hypothetical protein
MKRRRDRLAALLVALIAGMTHHPLPAAEPAHPDGAFAAVEGRGGVFVRLEGR